MSESYIADQLKSASRDVVEREPQLKETEDENQLVMHDDVVNTEEKEKEEVKHQDIDHVSNTGGGDDDDEAEEDNIADKALVEVASKPLHSASTSNNHTTKGTASNDLGTSTGQPLRKRRREVKQSGNKTSIGKFAKKFTADDEEKILKALAKAGLKNGTKDFWDQVSGSLQLSIQATPSQVYEKVRRLREKYIRASADPNNKLGMTYQELRLYELSEKIWVEEAKSFHEAEKVEEGKKEDAEEYEKKPKVMETGDHQDYDVKLDKFVSELRDNEYFDVKFPLSEALDLLSGAKKKKIHKKWRELNPPSLKLYLKRIELIQETLKAVVSSPSFPPTH